MVGKRPVNLIPTSAGLGFRLGRLPERTTHPPLGPCPWQPKMLLQMPNGDFPRGFPGAWATWATWEHLAGLQLQPPRVIKGRLLQQVSPPSVLGATGPSCACGSGSPTLVTVSRATSALNRDPEATCAVAACCVSCLSCSCPVHIAGARPYVGKSPAYGVRPGTRCGPSPGMSQSPQEMPGSLVMGTSEAC